MNNDKVSLAEKIVDCLVTNKNGRADRIELIRVILEGELNKWQPIETKPPFTPCYEKGEYRTDDGSLYYFKPTHWMPLPNPPEKK